MAAATQKSDVYQIITDRILTALKAGTVPWLKPWAAGSGLPRNAISKKAYRGANLVLLGTAEYASPFWLTFKQARDLDGCVKKGEKGTPITFWKFLEKTKADGSVERIPMLRYYTVFNVEQCDIPADKIPPVSGIEDHEHDPIDQAETVLVDSPCQPLVWHGGTKCSYTMTADRIRMAPRETFKQPEDYYSTRFHELVHATRHPSRLDREGGPFGSEVYAKEELVAEMGAAFLCAECGIVDQTIEQSAAYIEAWIKAISRDSKLVVQASGKAQRAVDYILGKQFS